MVPTSSQEVSYSRPRRTYLMLVHHRCQGFKMINLLKCLFLTAPLLGCSTSTANTALDVETLLRSSTAWNGNPYERYPEGRPELTVLRITIPPHTTLPWHTHPVPNAGYLLSGELLVEAADDGGQIRLKAGDALAEIVDGAHAAGQTSSRPNC